jgi:hypothetical protein
MWEKKTEIERRGFGKEVDIEKRGIGRQQPK